MAEGGAVAGSVVAKLELLARGGEERRTRGRKALSLRVFTMLKPEREKKGVGEGGGGGGGGGKNGHGQIMALLNGWNKKIGKLMAGTGNGGFAVDEKSGEKNSGFAG